MEKERTEVVVPEGYMQDSMDRMIPISKVKPIDKARDELVRELVGKALDLEGAITAFRQLVLGEMAAFIEMSAENHGVKMGGDKGNVTLRTYDGEYKIQRAVAEHMSFDEQLQVAKTLLDECFMEWTEGSCDELKLIVQDVFQTDSEGRLSTTRVLGLSRYNITHEKWQKAMGIIRESLRVDGSKTYVRIYKRRADGKYEHISLDVAA
ncbi:MAG: DUF3164 family protein [Deltaproteobacteria bacterium]|nr:DUF3164 family protein [Deltaproteobacteria bacterium]